MTQSGQLGAGSIPERDSNAGICRPSGCVPLRAAAPHRKSTWFVGRVYPHEVPLERESAWNELRDLIADLMVLAGLAVIGLGVYYFSEGWRAATFVLLLAAAFGSLLFGSGTLIHSGTTRRRLTMSSVALGLSSALTLALCSLLGPQPALLIVIAVPALAFSISLVRLRSACPRPAK